MGEPTTEAIDLLIALMSGFSVTLAEISRSNRDTERQVDMLATQMTEIMAR